MLEIKHVTKVYKAKGGVETKALDDVSISFGETGLVFLLGKSGSGKSTLLNVCGGLDEPTEGEVIVKGKSSKEFSGSDFDSYRNTFVGFIFQEYNVLDEFNVEDNIALALELQGKPKDKQKIAELLKEVELESFAKRKPNTLSGGQKQRIAIARALIKEPQIIMADEPTGALDSATGKQVFDTLKKLSETRLVIVVSHDREFAEVYGDRIVELKDGKIISDVCKAEVPPQSLDENVTVIGGNTLSIKSGSRLSNSNIKAIQDFVLSSEGDVIITKGEKEISSFKKANRMTESGATETFNNTDTESIVLKEYTRDDSKFIRSRLPAGKAIKIGASGLKLKPIRLIFTILLSFIAFTMFGLFSTLMLYDGDNVAVNSFMRSDSEFLNLTKSYVITDKYVYGNGEEYTYENQRNTKFTDAELKKFSAEYGNSTFGYFSTDYGSFGVDNVNLKSGKEEYYKNAIEKFAYIPAGHSVRNRITGNYPANTDEICISSFLLEAMNKENAEVSKVTFDKDDKVSYDGDNLTVNNAQDIIGNYIVVRIGGSRVPLKVTGVFDSGTVSPKYDVLKNSSSGGDNWMLSMQYPGYLSEGLFLLALVSEDFYDMYSYSFVSENYDYKSYFDNCNNSLYFSRDRYEYNLETGELIKQPDSDMRWLESSVKAFGKENQLKTYFFGGENKTSLSDKEMVVGINSLYDVTYNPLRLYYFNRIKEGAYDNDERLNLPELLSKDDLSYWDDDINHENGFYETEFGIFYDYQEYLRVYHIQYNNQINYFTETLINDYLTNIEKYREGEYWKNIYDENGKFISNEKVELTNAERLKALEEIVNTVNKLQNVEIELTIDDTRTVKFNVVGFHEMDITASYGDSDRGLYFSQNFIDSYLNVYQNDTKHTSETKYVEEEGAIYSGIYVEFDRNERTIRNVLGTIGMDNRTENDVVYNLQSTIYSSINMANSIAETLSTVFLIVGLVFALFSALLMFNFISVSISSKRKEIGILRAVGARGTDVFKIFFSEAGIITGICAVLAIIGAFVGCRIINSVLKAEVGLDVTLFVFGIASIGIMIGIALVVAFISTFLPVYFAARKKPVDSIRAL